MISFVDPDKSYSNQIITFLLLLFQSLGLIHPSSSDSFKLLLLLLLHIFSSSSFEVSCITKNHPILVTLLFDNFTTTYKSIDILVLILVSSFIIISSLLLVPLHVQHDYYLQILNACLHLQYL